MASKSNYSILVDVALQLDNIQKQLNQGKFTIPVTVTADGASSATRTIGETDEATRRLKESNEELGDSTAGVEVTYQQFKQILDTTVEVVSKMSESVFALNEAQTELKKVSDLTGDSLDAYTEKLSKMGLDVGRAGKPNRSEPVCRDGKAA